VTGQKVMTPKLCPPFKYTLTAGIFFIVYIFSLIFEPYRFILSSGAFSVVTRATRINRNGLVYMTFKMSPSALRLPLFYENDQDLMTMSLLKSSLLQRLFQIQPFLPPVVRLRTRATMKLTCLSLPQLLHNLEDHRCNRYSISLSLNEFSLQHIFTLRYKFVSQLHYYGELDLVKELDFISDSAQVKKIMTMNRPITWKFGFPVKRYSKPWRVSDKLVPPPKMFVFHNLLFVID
jgi:hypothetical protein